MPNKKPTIKELKNLLSRYGGPAPDVEAMLASDMKKFGLSREAMIEKSVMELRGTIVR